MGGVGKQTRVPVVLLDGQIHAIRVGDAVVEQAFFKSLQHQLGALAAGFGQTAQLGVAVIPKAALHLVADPG